MNWKSWVKRVLFVDALGGVRICESIALGFLLYRVVGVWF